ncbi:MAG: DUF721 domain-containing protein, partial [Nitrospiraceae bacterium]
MLQPSVCAVRHPPLLSALDPSLPSAYHAAMRPGSFFASVASILKAVAHRHGIEAPLFEYRLPRRWPEIVGDQLAAHTRPELIRFKKLYLIVENSVWLQQLTFLKPTLIEKINAAADGPVVSDIVLRVGEIARAPREGDGQEGVGTRDEAGPTPESVAQAAARAAIVKDPELRERLTMSIANALSPRP